ncbi:Predicted dehydrogenase [Haladaptatus litoreus]|uniref:Predicted dehydrogenase n=1 Tax=Haladaptatus litoreus TaxID=553468 RepID=A0A1N7DG58_9EURY|nr:Gfo/Idh/MocA family oxidoreductase [Haladaptatus litoreus]SIR74816.1 Predicted dehydrogenase [Haladaptatus litoreus]
MDVACIGAGVMASRLLEAVDDIDDCTLVAVCDIDENKAKEEAEPRNALVYTDHESMFAGLELDALIIAIPSFAHTDQAIKAAQQDIDLFVEKPVARRKEKAQEIRDAIETTGVLSQTGYLFRYADITERAKELIGNRTIGLMEGRYWGTIPGRPWGQKKENSGGGNVQLSTHLFDIMRYFGGEVRSIATYGNQRVRDEIDFEDVNSSSMEHVNGTISHVSTSCITPVRTDVNLIGDGFRLQLDYSAGMLSGEVDGEPIQYDGENTNHAITKEVRTFVDAVKEDDPSYIRTDYADGTKTLELTLAANESLETGNPVVLHDRLP